VDIKEAEQQVRNRIANVRNKLPDDIKEPIIRRFDPADQPIISLAINSKLNPADLYDVANEQIKPLLERVKDVGLVRIVGGQKKEIQISSSAGRVSSTCSAGIESTRYWIY